MSIQPANNGDVRVHRKLRFGEACEVRHRFDVPYEHVAHVRFNADGAILSYEWSHAKLSLPNVPSFKNERVPRIVYGPRIKLSEERLTKQ